MGLCDAVFSERLLGAISFVDGSNVLSPPGCSWQRFDSGDWHSNRVAIRTLPRRERHFPQQ